MPLNDGQGQYNEHVMYSHVWGNHRAKVDDDDLNDDFRGIRLRGTDTHTEDTHTQTQVVFLKCDPLSEKGP